MEGSPSPSVASTAAAKSTDPLIVVPHPKVFFPLPITSSIENIILLSNPTEHRVAFRIRTNVPDRTYSVKPRYGILFPKEDLKLRVTLSFETIQQKGGPMPDENTNDRFVVDAKTVSDDVAVSGVEKMWKETRKPDYRTEIPCVFSKAVPDSMVVTQNNPAKTTTPPAAQAAPEKRPGSPKRGVDENGLIGGGRPNPISVKTPLSIPPEEKPTEIANRATTPSLVRKPTSEPPSTPSPLTRRVNGEASPTTFAPQSPVADQDDVKRTNKVLSILFATMPVSVAIPLVLFSFLLSFVQWQQ